MQTRSFQTFFVLLILAFTSFVEASTDRSARTSFSIPQSLGTLEESFQGNSGKEIFFLQDAHDSLEAQKNIASLIDLLVNREQVSLVLEEGFEGLVPTDAYFAEFKNEKLRREVSSLLMDHLRLGGAEFAHINRRQEFTLKGVDDDYQHLKNIAYYQEAFKQQKEVLADLDTMNQGVQELARKLFSPALKDWMRSRAQLEETVLEPSAYIQRVARLGYQTLCKSQPATCEKKYPHLSFLFNPSLKVPQMEMNFAAAFQELDLLENQLLEKLVRNKTEREILKIYRIILLLRRAAKLQMTGTEYDYLKREMKDFSTQKITNLMGEIFRHPVVYSNRWENGMQSVWAFYETAQKRDWAVASQLEVFIRNSAYQKAILVFGGFHRQEIQKHLRRLQISYKTISPRIHKRSLKHEKNFQRQMMQTVLPFEGVSLNAKWNRLMALPERGIYDPVGARSEVRAARAPNSFFRRHRTDSDDHIFLESEPSVAQRALQMFAYEPTPTVIIESGNMVYGNPAFLKMLEDRGNENILGIPVSEVFKQLWGDEVDWVETADQFAMTGSDRIKSQIISVRNAEELFSRSFRVVFVPVLDLSGKVEAVRVSIYELTAENFQESIFQEVRKVTAEIPGGVFRLQIDSGRNPQEALNRSRFSFMSDGLMSIAGIQASAAEENSQIVWDRVHESDKPGLISKIGKALQGKRPLDHEFRFQKMDGSTVWLRLHTDCQNCQAQPQSWSGFFLDVTERRTLEAAVELNERQAMLGIRTAELAHDINNPLAAIYALLDLTQRTVGPAASENVQEYLTSIRRATEQIVHMVRLMLNFSRPSRGEEMTEVPLNEVVDNTLLLMNTELTAQRIRVQVQKDSRPLVIRGVSNSLMQILMNLISNAVKAMNSSNKKELSITLHQEEDGYVRLSITDTGIGMSDTRSIFDGYFTQWGNGSQGTGLGLSIVRRLVLSFNGSIEVQSKVGEGTTFTLRFPAVFQGQPGRTNLHSGSFSRVLPGPAVPAVSKNILLVEPATTLHNVVAAWIKHGVSDIHVQAVTSLAEAERLLNDQHMGVLIVSKDLLYRDSAEVVNRIHSTHPYLPLLVTQTGFEGEDLLQGEGEWRRYRSGIFEKTNLIELRNWISDFYSSNDPSEGEKRSELRQLSATVIPTIVGKQVSNLLVPLEALEKMTPEQRTQDLEKMLIFHRSLKLVFYGEQSQLSRSTEEWLTKLKSNPKVGRRLSLRAAGDLNLNQLKGNIAHISKGNLKEDLPSVVTSSNKKVFRFAYLDKETGLVASAMRLLEDPAYFQFRRQTITMQMLGAAWSDWAQTYLSQLRISASA